MKQLIIIITVSMLAGCFGKEPVKTGKEGKPMPEFSMLLTDSSTRLRSVDIPKGKPAVLFYFSPYCPFCKAQTKEIIEDINKLKSIHFYMISNYPFASLNAYKKEFQLDKYPNITIGLDSTNSIPDYFEATAVPYIAIFKKDKTLSKTYQGKIYTSQIVKAAEE